MRYPLSALRTKSDNEQPIAGQNADHELPYPKLGGELFWLNHVDSMVGVLLADWSEWHVIGKIHWRC